MAIFNRIFEPDFKDFTLETANLKCHIRFSKFGWRFKDAQKWLEKTIVEKMTPVMPYKTGKLVNTTIQKNASNYGDGFVTTYGMHYGAKLYNGINPKTGEPWHWTNPLTQPFWASYTVQQYKPELVQGVKDIIIKGAKK